jgi:hypothetical protein
LDDGIEQIWIAYPVVGKESTSGGILRCTRVEVEFVPAPYRSLFFTRQVLPSPPSPEMGNFPTKGTTPQMYHVVKKVFFILIENCCCVIHLHGTCCVQLMGAAAAFYVIVRLRDVVHTENTRIQNRWLDTTVLCHLSDLGGLVLNFL